LGIGGTSDVVIENKGKELVIDYASLAVSQVLIRTPSDVPYLSHFVKLT